MSVALVSLLRGFGYQAYVVLGKMLLYSALLRARAASFWWFLFSGEQTYLTLQYMSVYSTVYRLNTAAYQLGFTMCISSTYFFSGWVDSKTARMDLSKVAFPEPQQDRAQEARTQDRPQSEYVLRKPLELK
jgi:hypothetical protein